MVGTVYAGDIAAFAAWVRASMLVIRGRGLMKGRLGLTIFLSEIFFWFKYIFFMGQKKF